MAKLVVALVLALCLCAASANRELKTDTGLRASAFADPAPAKAAPPAKDENAAAPAKDESNEARADAMGQKAVDLLKGLPGHQLSVAMRTVLMLLFLFFLCQAVIKLIQTKQEITTAHMGLEEDEGDGGNLDYRTTAIKGNVKPVNLLNGGFFSLQALQGMKSAMDMVPMVCILVLFTRLRAVVELHTEPQAYAKGFFLVAGISIYVNALIALLTPLCGIGKGCTYKVFKVVDWLATLMLYASVLAIIISVCTLTRCQHAETKDQVYACSLDKKDLSTHVNSLASATKKLFF